MKYVFKEARAYWFQILISLVFGAIWSMTLVMPPKFLANIIDIGIASKDTAYIYSQGLNMVLVTILNLLTFLINIGLITYVSCAISKKLRSRVYQRVMSFSKHEMDKFGTSTLINRISNDMVQIQNTVDFFFRKVFTIIITVAGALYLSFDIDADLSKLIFLIVPVIILTSFILSKKSSQPYKDVRASLDELNRRFGEHLKGILVIKAFNKESFQKNRFDRANDKVLTKTLEAERLMMLLSPITGLAMNLIVVLIVWTASHMIEVGNLQIGSLVAVIEYVAIALANILAFTHFASIMPRSKVSMDRLGLVLDENVSETGHYYAEKGKDLEAKNLTFQYPQAQLYSLYDINLDFERGKTTAIIGSTGSGKSTLLRLLLGVYPDLTGAILYDGRPLSQYKNIYEIFSYVPQKSFLFQGSLRDNLLMAKKDASDEEIWQALENAHIADLFKKIQGLDSPISQGGTNLSGGQRQRVAIARAILKDAEVYIFDDSFSALDVKTESIVRSNIKKLLKDKVLILVAQRISTVRDADQIVVLDHGLISGKGSHDYLLENNEIYQEILDSQLSEEDRI